MATIQELLEKTNELAQQYNEGLINRSELDSSIINLFTQDLITHTKSITQLNSKLIKANNEIKKIISIDK